MEHLSEIIRKSASLCPERIALIEPEGNAVSYKELGWQVSDLSRKLQSFQIGKGDIVGVLMQKSIDSVTGILAIIDSGAAYVPSDASAPISRSAFIFKDSQVKGVLIEKSLSDNLKNAFPENVLEHDLDGFDFKFLEIKYAKTKLITPPDLAYILYTSGSTGYPKGVLITHQNALCFIDWSVRVFPFSEKEIFSSIAAFHFDLSIFDLYVGLRKGATIVLINQKLSQNPRGLSECIEFYQISTLYATPTLLKLLLRYGKLNRRDHDSLKTVLFAGEVFPIEPFRQLKTHWTQAQFYNLYGPTETNVVTCFEIPKSINEHQKSSFPIGYPCDFAVCKIWNHKIEEALPGNEGELIVKGKSVAKGYLNLKEKTAGSFLETNGEVWYKTGDLVKVDQSGAFVFLGRKDRMVKRRGYRIELAEIENTLYRHPNISEAGAVVLNDPQASISIRVFYVLHEKEKPINALEIRDFFLKHLPKYMLPDEFINVSTLPKTSTQKVDYQKLKTIEA